MEEYEVLQEMSCSVLRIDTNDALTDCTKSFHDNLSITEAMQSKLGLSGILEA